MQAHFSEEEEEAQEPFDTLTLEEQKEMEEIFGSSETKKQPTKPDLDPQVALARQLRRAWKANRWQECESLIESFEPPTNTKALNTLEALLFNHHIAESEISKREERIRLRQLQIKLLDLISTSSKPKAFSLLIDTLSLPSEMLAEHAQALLQNRGVKALPALLKRVDFDKKPHGFHIHISDAGFFRVLFLLGELPEPRAIDALFDIVGLIKRPLFGRKDTLLISVIVGIIGVALYTVLGDEYPILLPFPIVSILVIHLLVRAINKPAGRRVAPFQLQAMEGIAKHPQKGRLLLLLEIFESKNFMEYEEGQNALLAYLEILIPEEADILRDSQRLWLVQQVAKAPPELGLEILKIVEWVGSIETLPTLQRLAKRPPSPEIQRKVTEILPLIRERSEGVRAPEQLLRATHSPDLSDTLLRPAQNHNEPNEAEYLLRPDTDSPPEI